MENPFETIIIRLNSLETKLNELKKSPTCQSIEIINRAQLCDRLGITEPTAIAWEQSGKIPSFRIGVNVRYNWGNVLTAIGAKTKKKK